MGQDNCKPQPGDLIEIDRKRHKHWALYMGNGYVINLTPAGKKYLKLGIHTVPVFIRRVKKQRLEQVVQNNTWRVNNESDRCHRPLPLKEIICRAIDYIDKDFTYRLFGSNCEYFVKKLRYGDAISDQGRDFVRGEMHRQDMTDHKDSPSPGDLIEIHRQTYQHWALYLGKGYVIHVTNAEGAPSMFASSGSVLTRKAKVKKELLKDVAQNDAWDVYNKYDLYRIPLPMEVIIRRAEPWIDKELPYGFFDSNSEQFVTMLRYGDRVSDKMWASVCGEMYIPDKAYHMNFPNPGDLIEIKRGPYEHWALYLGKGHVIHATTDGGLSSLSPNICSIPPGKAKVRKDPLEHVTKNDIWRVNNKYDCYRTPFPMVEIIRRAEPWIGKEVTYGLFFNNCEHFVTMLRYGEGVSRQVMAAIQNINHISSVVTAGVGYVSLAVAAGIPVVGLPLLASAVFGAVGGGSLIASYGLSCSNISYPVSSSQFENAGRDILEQSCC